VVQTCLYCPKPRDAQIPDGPVCREHAIEFYTGLVRVGAALHELNTAVPPDYPKWPIPLPPPVQSETYERTCRRCGAPFTTHRERSFVCADCKHQNGLICGEKGRLAAARSREARRQARTIPSPAS
jgi:hypothetical protein